MAPSRIVDGRACVGQLELRDILNGKKRNERFRAAESIETVRPSLNV